MIISAIWYIILCLNSEHYVYTASSKMSSGHTSTIHDSSQPEIIFCHGRCCSGQDDLKKYQNAGIIAKHKAISFDFDDAKQYRKDQKRHYMGHGNDVNKLKENINKNEHQILFGFSRGGAVVAKYVAEDNPFNVKAIMIQGAPADIVETVIDHPTEKFFGIQMPISLPRFIKEYIVSSIYQDYPRYSKPAIQAVGMMNNKIRPFLIIHSQQDSLVHIRSAWDYYLAAKRSGARNVYLYELSSGDHNQALLDPHQEEFQKAVHSFYKACDFTYDPQYATLSASDLQPAEKDIIEKLEADKALNSRYKLIGNTIITTALFFFIKGLSRKK